MTDLSACLSPSVCLPPSLAPSFPPSLCFLTFASCLSPHLSPTFVPSFLARPSLVLCISARFFLKPALVFRSGSANLQVSRYNRRGACVGACTRARLLFLINLFHLAQHPHEWRRAKLVPVKPAIYSHT